MTHPQHICFRVCQGTEQKLVPDDDGVSGDDVDGMDCDADDVPGLRDPKVLHHALHDSLTALHEGHPKLETKKNTVML
jgi:hypothetical protein